MSRAVLRCQACRCSLLDAFTSLAGVSLSSQRTLHSFSPIQNRALPRPIHTTARRLQSIQAEKSENNADVETQPSTESDAPQSEAQPVPWYLEIDNPEPPAPMTSPILARQQIPPLPSNPPAVLSLVLNHLSTSIGLDDLTLLDLRTLSPPPALGANLLMIIGTARSVKHLNVSADRFCRWLRTNYKLRPYADGLLGRNELKLKLRRKARRLKLERAAGRQSDHNADDGITTGWVCVNVGPVDQVEIPTSTITTAEGDVAALKASEISEDIDEDEDGEEYINPEAPELDEHDLLAHAAPPHDVDSSYVGFGSRATSQRIVVQMFTEEKRAEMNLEELWNARNTRMLRREEKAEKRVEYVLKQREGEEMRRRMERGEAQKEKGALGEVMEEGDGEDVKEMLERLEDLSVREKEELRRRIETLRQERGEAAEKKVEEDPKWSPIFNVKPRP